MKTYKLKTGAQSVIDEWMMKECGSYEDSGWSQDHAVAILERFEPDSTVDISIKEAKTLLRSASYNATAWKPDEIRGGIGTLSGLFGYMKRLTKLIESAKES